MCGIAGAINLEQGIDISKFQNMTSIIKHRGPDDEGFYFSNEEDEVFAYSEDTINEVKSKLEYSVDALIKSKYNIALGHRRLSIIDISPSGHQPMSFSDIVIVYNGEIYNYLEIKEELLKNGFTFVTKGDTEVIINAYLHWGEKCVEHFNGMWAFAIWDKRNSKLFCSRDRLGEKPFFYQFSKNTITFGSEIKQIIEYGIKPIVNDEIMHTFLVSGIHDFSEETFFEGIYNLPGGNNMSIKIDLEKNIIGINKYEYWNLDDSKYKSNNKNNVSFEEYSKITGSLLEKSIELRLRSDVEVGSCLSGGLDSSSVVTLACAKLDEKRLCFKTFTATYNEHKEVDEKYYSDLVVKDVGCKNTKVKPNVNKLKSDFEKLVWHQDEPFGSMGIFASWCVMEAANKEKVKVLLDGQGGDETLLGYERFYAYILRDKLFKLNFKEFVNELNLSSDNSKLSFKNVIAYFFYFNNKMIRKSRLFLKANKFMDKKFLKEYNLKKVNNILSFKTIEGAQMAELKKFISHLLRYEDRNSMAHSIEARVPFLETKFVEETLMIPNEFKLRDGWTKAMLREFMKDKMPMEVVYRKNKLGFSVPQQAWLNELNDYFKEYLLEKSLSSKYFDVDYIKKIFDNKTNSDLRFKFIMVESWMRVFNIGNGRE
ncbi:MAG: asparagine synthase (glutamine-hydrolyzing) [Lachnotalea sp.]